MYQDRSQLVVGEEARPIAPAGGTAMATTRRHRSGASGGGAVGGDRAPVVADEHGAAVAAERLVQGAGVARPAPPSGSGRRPAPRSGRSPAGTAPPPGSRRSASVGEEVPPGPGRVGEPVQAQRQRAVGRARRPGRRSRAPLAVDPTLASSSMARTLVLQASRRSSRADACPDGPRPARRPACAPWPRPTAPTCTSRSGRRPASASTASLRRLEGQEILTPDDTAEMAAAIMRPDVAEHFEPPQRRRLRLLRRPASAASASTPSASGARSP